MKHILSKLHNLRCLEFKTTCSVDLVDGFWWESVSRNLLKLDLYLMVYLASPQETLTSFLTSYWLLEKCWFVAYEPGQFFTVPRFAKTTATMDYCPPVVTTALIEDVLFKHVTTLDSSMALLDPPHHFPRVRTLTVNDNMDFEVISTCIPLNQITHIIYSLSSADRTPISYHLCQMPRVHTLSIKRNILNFLGRLQNSCFDQIKTLIIAEEWSLKNTELIEQLCRSFPCVERLEVESEDLSVFIKMIDGFRDLSNASLTCYNITEKQSSQWVVNPEWALYGARRLTVGKFSCRFSQQQIYAWIDRQVC